MTKRTLKYIIPLLILLPAIAIVAMRFYPADEVDVQVFDTEAFRQIGYTDEELALFEDIAFNRKDSCIRKWNTDIRIEIDDIAHTKEWAVKEVDSAIIVLAPLIAPHKIYRVNKNGNVKVYRTKRSVTLTDMDAIRPVALHGLTKKNKVTESSSDITSASVYVRQGAATQTLLHEFMHVLGVEHPSVAHPFYVTIGRSVIPNHLYPKGGEPYIQQRFYISEQEKTAIRMLYHPSIRSGLTKSTFLLSIATSGIR